MVNRLQRLAVCQMQVHLTPLTWLGGIFLRRAEDLYPNIDYSFVFIPIKFTNLIDRFDMSIIRTTSSGLVHCYWAITRDMWVMLTLSMLDLWMSEYQVKCTAHSCWLIQQQIMVEPSLNLLKTIPLANASDCYINMMMASPWVRAQQE